MQQAAVNFAGRALGDQPAHPYTEHNDDGSHYYDNSGLTKRELIAAMAMQGNTADHSDYATSFVLGTIGLPLSTKYEVNIHWPMFVAKRSVALADALLAELAKDGAA